MLPPAGNFDLYRQRTYGGYELDRIQRVYGKG